MIPDTQRSPVRPTLDNARLQYTKNLSPSLRLCTLAHCPWHECNKRPTYKDGWLSPLRAWTTVGSWIVCTLKMKQSKSSACNCLSPNCQSPSAVIELRQPTIAGSRRVEGDVWMSPPFLHKHYSNILQSRCVRNTTLCTVFL